MDTQSSEPGRAFRISDLLLRRIDGTEMGALHKRFDALPTPDSQSRLVPLNVPTCRPHPRMFRSSGQGQRGGNSAWFRGH